MFTYEELKDKFIKYYGKKENDILLFFAPARINLIGEHIDYNGGNVLPAALSIGIYGLFRKRNDNKILLKSENREKTLEINLYDDLTFISDDDWCNYPKGIIKYLKNLGCDISGGEIYFFSNMPEEAGLSSSAAIEVLTSYIFIYISKFNIDLISIAKLCQKVENEFIGVNCGIMDQFASALGKKNNAIYLNTSNLDYKHIPINLDKYKLVIMNTNKKRILSESKYNERRNECNIALEEIKKHKNIKNLVDASIEDCYDFISDEIIRKRAIHVISENQRVNDTLLALEKNDIIKFGELLNQSHESLKNNYEVTGFELDSIVLSAQSNKYCIGARMTGAGFAGCAIAIVEADYFDVFKENVYEEYKKKTSLCADFYLADISDGVHFISNL